MSLSRRSTMSLSRRSTMNLTRALFVLGTMATLLSPSLFAADAPLGWASLNGGTTGGAGGDTVEVTSLSAANAELKKTVPVVVLIKGTLTGRLDVAASNKTVYGLPGAKIVGGVDITGSSSKTISNIIVRNLIVEGPGAVDVNGVDGIAVAYAENVWIDHVEAYDGQDGNLDIVNKAHWVTVSWTKFHYTSKSKNHMFSNLIGNDDDKTTDRGRLGVTLHHNWWTTGVIERMPRVRFGKVHVVNNLFDSPQSSTCVRAGIEADLLVESNVFRGVKTPIDQYENNFKAITARGNLFFNTSGNQSGKNTAFTPDYKMPIDSASTIESKIKAGAGATLPDPRTVKPSSSSVPVSSSSVKPSSSSVVASSSSIISSSSSSVKPSSSSSVPSSSSAVIIGGGRTLIVATNGTDGAAGTLANPTTLTSAITRIQPGDTILVRGGQYNLSVQVTIERSNSGTQTQHKHILAYPSETPVLDFSTQPYGSNTADNLRGVWIGGNWWHVRGLTVRRAADNGIFVAGNDNIIENCITHGNRDTGIQISRYASTATRAEWPSRNLILNCESYDNYDEPPLGGENADGFACKLTCGDGNVFKGCIAHHNIDDGWDLYTKDATGAIGVVVIDQCIAHHNGSLRNGTTNESGDRNGFKLGGEDIAVAHVVTRSVAFANGKNGFTWNSNPGAMRISNNLAWNNVDGNFKFGDNSTTTQTVYTNNVSFWTQTSSDKSDKTVGTSVGSTNAWWDASKSQPSINSVGIVVGLSDFAQNLGALTGIPRNSQGLPDFSLFRLSAGSDLIDAGSVPAGELPFVANQWYKGDPDLGAFESFDGQSPVFFGGSAAMRHQNWTGSFIRNRYDLMGRTVR